MSGAAEADLRSQVLEVLRGEGKPVSVRDLAGRLELDREARHELNAELRRMIADGEIVKISGSRVGLPSRMNLVVGRLTCNPGGFGFVVPETGTPSRATDVYVAAGNLRDALHGDRVVVRVERSTPKGLEGRVIRVLERGLQRIVGRYERDGAFGGRVAPFDARVLHELFVPAGEEAGAQAGEMVAAEITRPPTATRNPIGKVLERLGRLEDPGVDVKVVMAKYGLPDAFPPEVEAAADRVPKAVGPEEARDRTDFRPWGTVTVDPETARDHDDAISLDRMGNGNWLLGVHIADVAHYVPEASALDQEAYLRGTSVYFPDRVVPMLPHALSSHICSLVEGEDRLSQTVVLELDGAGKLVRSEFHDGVIRVDAKLAYPQAQAIVDGDPDARARFAAVVPMLQRMDELAKLLRRRRYERGSLDFDLPEPKLVLGASGEMTGIVAGERLDSMRAIEEFMLAANEAVAARLSSAGVGALYRVHERPDPERVAEFCELVASFGYRIPAELDEIAPEDFQSVLKQIEGRPEEKLVSYLLLRTMKLARYHEQNLGHFGLATEMYAHFTSPIRRYPDLVVHRALRALRKAPDTERQASLREALPEMGRHLSEMERRASDAEREIVEWKKVRFMADKLGEAFRGYVTGVQAFGLFVELEEVFVQGLVHVSSMSDDYYHLDEKGHLLRGESGGKLYRLGDRVEVQLVRADLARRQLDFALVDVLQRAGQGGGGAKPRPSGARSSGPREGAGRSRSTPGAASSERGGRKQGPRKGQGPSPRDARGGRRKSRGR
jgi:ribonuclease R